MSHLHRYNKTQVTVGGGKRDVGKGVGLVLGKRVSVLEMDKRLEINGQKVRTYRSFWTNM